jgi:hypothetical protein
VDTNNFAWRLKSCSTEAWRFLELSHMIFENFGKICKPLKNKNEFDVFSSLTISWLKCLTDGSFCALRQHCEQVFVLVEKNCERINWK